MECGWKPKHRLSSSFHLIHVSAWKSNIQTIFRRFQMEYNEEQKWDEHASQSTEHGVMWFSTHFAQNNKIVSCFFYSYKKKSASNRNTLKKKRDWCSKKRNCKFHFNSVIFFGIFFSPHTMYHFSLLNSTFYRVIFCCASIFLNWIFRFPKKKKLWNSQWEEWLLQVDILSIFLSNKSF